MTKPFICWDSHKVAEYFNIEASSTVAKLGWEVFRQLHVPIRRIEVIRSRLALKSVQETVRNGDARSFIDETEFLRVLLNAVEGENFLIAVRGGPGSGKSHLIRWLELQLQDHQDRFIAVPVPRELASIGVVLNRVAAAVGLQPSYEENPDADIDDLTDLLIDGIKVRMKGDERDAVTSEAMRRLVRDSVDRFQAHRLARKLGRGAMTTPDLDRAELRRIYFDSASDDLVAADHFCDVVDLYYNRTWLSYVTGTEVNVAEFMKKVEAKARERGLRPVLLMEDVTSFEVLHRQLLNFLSSLAAGSFIAVLGWTTAYEKDNVQTNVLDRLAMHVSLSDESAGDVAEETYNFSDPDHLVQLAQTYMRAVRVPSCGRDCLSGYCNAGAGDRLYPFTASAIQKFYSHLIDRDSHIERRTPRLLLSTVMQPLLNAAITFGRFPKMDDALSLDPIPTPVSYRTLGPEFADWIQAKLWFHDDETPAAYLEDLGIRIPDHEPLTTDTVVDTMTPTRNVDEERRAKAEREFRIQVRKLDAWIKGDQLESVDTWLSLVSARVAASQAGGVTPYPGRHVKIEGSGAARAAPFAIEIPRNQQGKDLLQSIARREAYGHFEASWEGVYVQSRLAMDQRQAERAWAKSLKTSNPTLGLLLETIALDAAIKGDLKGDDLPSILTVVVSDPPGVGAPLLGPTLRTNRADLERLAKQFTSALRSVCRERQDTFDISFYQNALAAYRQQVATGQRFEFTGSLRLGTETIQSADLIVADNIICQFYREKLRREIDSTRTAAASFEQAQPLGQGFAESMRQVRHEYESWKSQTVAATVWATYQQAVTQFGPLLPSDIGELSDLAKDTRQNWKTIDQTLGLLIKLSRLSALRPNNLRAAAEIAKAAHDVITRIERDVRQEERIHGKDVLTPDVSGALEELTLLATEVPE